MTEYLRAEYGPLKVHYAKELDGGGSTFGQAYVPFVRQHFGTVRDTFEWCAGPGFIGLSLLAAGLSENLTLGDVNEAAQRAVARTVEENGLDDRVRFFLSDCFAQVPGGLKWDLVVGNPPHVNAVTPHSEFQLNHSPLMWQDVDWSLHRRFYTETRERLNPGGAVLIQENYKFSQPEEFTGMIQEAGLELVGAFPCGTGHEDYYFLWSRLPRE